MKMFNTSLKYIMAAGVASAVATMPASANDAASWPTRDLRIVVPYPAGGFTDSLTRIIAEQLSSDTGVAVIVENKPGANGQIGLNDVINAPKDGHTLGFVVPATMMTLPLTDPNYKIKPLEQLAPLTAVAETYLALVVAPQLGLNTLSEFVDYAKANPGKLSYGVPGVGTTFHFSNVLMAQKLGFTATSVPYAGESRILTDLAGGHVDYALVSPGGGAKAFLDGGKVKALAVTSRERMVLLPNIPTFDEGGIDLRTDGWLAYATTAGTPEPVLDKISETLIKAAKAPRVVELLNSMGFVVLGTPRSELQDLINTRSRFYSDVIKSGAIVLKDE